MIQRTENQLRSETQRTAKEAQEGQVRQEQKDALTRGEKPVFKSKRAQREEDIVKSYEELKEKGKLDNFIRKKNKKNTSKDRKMLGKSYDE